MTEADERDHVTHASLLTKTVSVRWETMEPTTKAFVAQPSESA
jgi:hypothetical protein